MGDQSVNGCKPTLSSGLSMPILRRFLWATGSMTSQILVGIIMGSQSDWPTLRAASEILEALDVAHETKIVSAHRTPDRLFAYGKGAAGRGLKVLIAGAGGAAHLPGMAA